MEPTPARRVSYTHGMVRFLIWAVAAVCMVFPTAAPAQIVNGDFEDGLSGWVVEDPQPSKPDALGPAHGWQFHAFDGHANILVSGTDTPAEEGHLSQVFTCGEAGGNCECRIRLEFRLLFQGIGDSDLATIFIYMDRSIVFQTKQYTDDIDTWLAAEFSTPCGTREIALCLFVDTGVSSWTCSFDNVTATPALVGADGSTWGRMKRLF